MANIYEMDIDQLLYAFQERMTVLIKREASKPQGYEHFHLNQIEDELMPLINEMVDYDPTPSTPRSVRAVAALATSRRTVSLASWSAADV